MGKTRKLQVEQQKRDRQAIVVVHTKSGEVAVVEAVVPFMWNPIKSLPIDNKCVIDQSSQ